ncbi:putative disease resistance protein At1g59780 [Salvia miltiorrhiza]|uniref:putative disease resistance protein At1g59780 n=1 Tax=Salvia miltiorrhiza TaxID=226208 RepID=UPI0025ABF58F|nr:putative disease resistance protein At1g59780 [Salvia miltiorrhiza]
MPHIRHVEFFTLRLADPPNDRDDIVLGNLQRLGKVLDFKCSKEVVKKIPNIKKLVFSNGGERDDDMYCLSNLDALTKLKSLNCSFLAMGAINFPQSLKSLVLRSEGSSYCWQDILDKVGVLPHLRKLILNNGRFNQGKWETTEGQFCGLIFLSVKWCDGIEIWNTQSSHFPCLESLHLVEVCKLVEIPLDFAEISTLREIDVNRCSDAVVESAKRISEEHEDYYGEGALQVRIELASPHSELASPNSELASSNSEEEDD